MFRRALLMFVCIFTLVTSPYILSSPVLSASLAQTVAAPKTATVARGANLRAGPGTNYAVVGTAKAGQTLTLVGKNAAGDWYQLDTGAWIATFLVTINPGPPDMRGVTATGQPAQVTNIVDGDTIDVAINGQTVRLRYILINTPEEGQPLSKAATEANRLLVGGKTVYLVKDISETDRYGRLLRYVYLADGTFVNAELVRQGYAQLATFPPDVTKEGEIRGVQQEAIAAGRGLWAGETANTTAPVVQPTMVATTAPVVPTNTPLPVPTVTPVPPAPAQQPGCHASYSPCVPIASDVDCEGGSGNGPAYVRGPVTVIGPDEYGLDRDGDGVGCESN